MQLRHSAHSRNLDCPKISTKLDKIIQNSRKKLKKKEEPAHLESMSQLRILWDHQQPSCLAASFVWFLVLVLQHTNREMQQGDLPWATATTKSIGKWFQFHHREHMSGEAERQGGPRWQGPHARHGVRAQVTAVVALATSSDTQATKMAAVMASTIELLSLEHSKVATAVQAAVVVRSPGDLMTLTVAGRPQRQSKAVNVRFLI